AAAAEETCLNWYFSTQSVWPFRCDDALAWLVMVCVTGAAGVSADAAAGTARGGGAGLAPQVVQVRIEGLPRHVQPLGHLAEACPLGKVRQHLALARGERSQQRM